MIFDIRTSLTNGGVELFLFFAGFGFLGNVVYGVGITNDILICKAKHRSINIVHSLLINFGVATVHMELHVFLQLLNQLLSLGGEIIFFTVVDDRALDDAVEVEPELVDGAVVLVGETVQDEIEPHFIGHPTFIIIGNHFFNSHEEISTYFSFLLDEDLSNVYESFIL